MKTIRDITINQGIPIQGFQEKIQCEDIQFDDVQEEDLIQQAIRESLELTIKTKASPAKASPASNGKALVKASPSFNGKGPAKASPASNGKAPVKASPSFNGKGPAKASPAKAVKKKQEVTLKQPQFKIIQVNTNTKLKTRVKENVVDVCGSLFDFGTHLGLPLDFSVKAATTLLKASAKKINKR
jgi:hypothetical protein